MPGSLHWIVGVCLDIIILKNNYIIEEKIIMGSVYSNLENASILAKIPY